MVRNWGAMSVEWHSHGVALPPEIQKAWENDSLVLFCGAGVSAAAPSKLPGFRGLTSRVAISLDRAGLVPKDVRVPVQFDAVMGELNEIQGDVHARVNDELRSTTEPNSYHEDLIRIASAKGRTPRIVTTNFDQLLEGAARRHKVTVPVASAPALPLGNDFEGIVHLHGVLSGTAARRMVLTDRDFGQAYITQGWATQFLARMFERYTVLFVGYSADDTVVRYLARALPADGSTRFAFTADSGDDTMAKKWGRLGVTPVAYPSPEGDSHGYLQRFMSAWASRITAPAEQNYDRISAIVDAGPADPGLVDADLPWLLDDAEHARQFQQLASAASWSDKLLEEGILAPLFSTAAPDSEMYWAWAAWLSAGSADEVAPRLLRLLGMHGAEMSAQMWFHVWRFLRVNYEASPDYRQLLMLLAMERPDRDDQRLADLLSPVTEKDPAAAEMLLRILMSPQLLFTPGRPYFSSDTTLQPALQLGWNNTSIRGAWPALLSTLTDPDHLLGNVLDLIRTAEAADSVFTGSSRNALSRRRHEVDGDEPFGRDDPWTLVVDIARDVLREFVRSEGPSAVDRHHDSPSEMIRRLALDALAEAKSSEADLLVDLVISRDLAFDISTKPEVFRVMKRGYDAASESQKTALVAYLLEAEGAEDRTDIRDYERYNALVWISHEEPASGPAGEALKAFQADHPDFGPRPHPDLNSWMSYDFEPVVEPPATGRFAGFTPAEVAAALSSEHELNDPYENRTPLTELQAYLLDGDHLELDLFDELLAHQVFAQSAWSVVMTAYMTPDNDWTSPDLISRLLQLPGDLGDLARAQSFKISVPDIHATGVLDHADERCRVLLALWRRVGAEAAVKSPYDSAEGQGTARGSLAYHYVETVIRASQEKPEPGISDEHLEGLTEVFTSREGNALDPSPAMIGKFAGYLLARAPSWFDAYVQPHLGTVDESEASLVLWSGVFASHSHFQQFRDRTRSAVCTGWPAVAKHMPGSEEAFLQLHSVHFAYDTAAEDAVWADPFIATAPIETHARWIRSVARHLDGASVDAEALLIAHWEHRLAGQPPIHAPEQAALLEWLSIPHVDVGKAVELFLQGPPVGDGTRGGFDYFGVPDLSEDHDEEFLKVSVHLLRGRDSLPSFVSDIVQRAERSSATTDTLRDVWRELLRLGFTPAREQLHLL